MTGTRSRAGADGKLLPSLSDIALLLGMLMLRRRRRRRRPAAPAPCGEPRAKSIILFSDGTGNSSAALFKTNVWRMYEAVDLGPAPSEQQRQIAFYDNGVGTSALRPLALLGGVFGFGLRRNVLEIYQYACRNYNPRSLPLESSGIRDKGDHIYGFGFSRGAFTMRLVIGMIADQGLVPYRDEADLEWKARAAYKEFRRHRRPRMWSDASAESKEAVQKKMRATGYDSSMNYQPVIRFVGVWDTVAAYGGPVTEITRAVDNWFYRLSMPNYELSPHVRRARHALALDDARDAFHPLLWDEVAEEELIGTPSATMPWLDSKRLEQVWFAGMHADVGGGYPDESLSYVSLLWIMEEAERSGLRTLDQITSRYRALANSFGPIHDSRSGPGGYYRYQPRRISAWTDPPDHQMLSVRDPDLRRPDGSPKGLLLRPAVHESVIARIASGTEGYAPIVLPPEFDIVPPGRLDEAAPQPTSGGDAALMGERNIEQREAIVSARVIGWLSSEVKASMAAAMEMAWDIVWWRRVVYFLTLITTLFLVAMPLWADALAKTTGVAGWERIPHVTRLGEKFGTVIHGAGAVLPELLQHWVSTWENHPWWFAAIVVILIALIATGTRLERRTSDLARGLWHQAVPRIPPASAASEPTEILPKGRSALGRWRTGRGYQRTAQLLKWSILPHVIAFAMVLAGLYLLYWLFVA